MPRRKAASGVLAALPWNGAAAAVRPMLAVLAERHEVPLVSDRLVYEPKYDGIRALVAIEPPAPIAHRPSPAPVTIWSRNGLDKTAQFPELVEAFARLAARRRTPLLLDGEIVALDDRGRPSSFARIQPRIHVTGAKEVADAARAQPVAFIAFDLLRDGGDDLRRLPLAARRVRLQRAFRPPRTSPLRVSEMVAGDGRSLLARAEREGWEGLIAKDAASIYETGRRSPAWRKLKFHQRQEFVVGGWTGGRGSRAHFGALLLGVWDAPAGAAAGRRPPAAGRRPPAAHRPSPDAHRLRFVGSVGTGFDEKELERVAALLKPLETQTCPFTARPAGEEHGAARGRGGPRKRRAWRGAGDPALARLGLIHWARPDLVVDVKYAEFTPDGRLRHPVYLGLRDDKPARAVRLERPVVSTAPQHPSTALIARLHALEDARKDGWLDLTGGHRLHVTNLWKIFWPELKITKGDLLRYYVEVSPFILPAVMDRPLVMKRFPNGIHGKAFYQQRVIERPPAGVRVETLPEGMDPIGEEEQVRNPQRLVGGAETTLLYMAQMAAISQDPWFSTVRAPLEADEVAIDLDPGEGVSWQIVLDVARWVRDELDRLHIPGVPKTSGSRGLHIYIPLPRGSSYETGQLLCQIVATLVSSKHPKRATIERMVRKRPAGTVYVDYLQNILGKTLATAYSARASAFAGVSTPLTWKEVDEGIDARAFTIRTAPARFREVGDLWANLRTRKKVDLHRVMDRIERT